MKSTKDNYYKICTICGKDYKDAHYRSSSKCCNKTCRQQYKNIYGKKGLLQRNKEGLLLCYDCLEYKNDNDFHTLFERAKCPESRNRRNTKCKKCFLVSTNEDRNKSLSTLEGTIRSRFMNSRISARKRGISYDSDLRFEDLMDIYNKQEGKCNITGEVLEIGGKKRSETLSLDRIDSFKGYTKDNIQFVCWAVNQMKNNLSEEELMIWCKRVINNKLELCH